jgi:hypothetical protein
MVEGTKVAGRTRLGPRLSAMAVADAKRLLGLWVALLILTGCSAATGYPLLSQGSESWHPTSIGAPVDVVVLYLQPNPGDQIELLSAEPVGVAAGADVAFFYSPPVHRPDGGLVIGDRLEPLAGVTFGAPADASPGPGLDVGVVGRMTARLAGTYTLTGVRLRFRVNGGQEQVKEGITEVTTVCAGSPSPACGPTPP